MTEHTCTKPTYPNGAAELLPHIRTGTKLRFEFQKDPPKAGARKHGGLDRGTLGDETRAALTYFLGMLRGGLFTVDGVGFGAEMTMMTLMAVMQSGYWDSDRNRFVNVVVTDQFDPAFFTARTRYGYAKITAVNN